MVQLFISQKLDNENIIATNLTWINNTLFYGDTEIILDNLLPVPYDFLLHNTSPQRRMEFNRKYPRKELLEKIETQRVIPGLYLSSQSEVDNLVIETILEGFSLVSFSATDNWLYALFSFDTEDKLIWWDGEHLTLAGNFRR